MVRVKIVFPVHVIETKGIYVGCWLGRILPRTSKSIMAKLVKLFTYHINHYSIKKQ